MDKDNSGINYKKNLDRSTMLGFGVVASVGFFSTLHKIRDRFEEGFIRGWGHIETPFSQMIRDYEKIQDSNTESYKAGRIEGTKYRNNIIENARTHRNEIATKLENEFQIPTKGLAGWTEGTAKRFMHLTNKSKVATASTAIGLGVITWVGYALLRNTKYTLDQIDKKLDSSQHNR